MVLGLPEDHKDDLELGGGNGRAQEHGREGSSHIRAVYSGHPDLESLQSSSLPD